MNPFITILIKIELARLIISMLNTQATFQQNLWFKSLVFLMQGSRTN